MLDFKHTVSKSAWRILFYFHSLWIVACALPFPSQFGHNSKDKDQIFPIDKVIQSECHLVTGEPLGQGVFKSVSEKVTMEGASPFESVVFDHHTQNKQAPTVINNLPYVYYEIKGSQICRDLLGKIQDKIIAKPHFKYPVRFQIAGPYLRALMISSSKNFPYQKMANLIPYGHQYAIPLGGYAITQGLVRKIKNVENQETHILDFFPNENTPYDHQFVQDIENLIRRDSSHIFVKDLNDGFTRFEYKIKNDTLPKNYFDGAWYSSISVISVEPLASTNTWLSSGVDVSGDSFSNSTYGQKIYFKFESDYLKAFNENYMRQGEEKKMIRPVEAEVLSLPIQHIDYQHSSEGSVLHQGMSEEENMDLSWQDRRYAQIDFSKVDYFHNKLVKYISSIYGPYFRGMNFKTQSSSIKEIRFSDDYFDFVLFDSNFEIRFAFRRKKPSSYKPKSVVDMDSRFGYFYLHDHRIFKDASEQFKSDYAENNLVLRVHPDQQNRIVLHFSNLTPQDQKIRSIGLEAVSLWNQALRKASLPITIEVDQTKDVHVGDNRYHVLNMPSVRGKGYIGVASETVDDDTGEIVSTTSNVIIPVIMNALESAVIHHAYNQHKVQPSLSQFHEGRSFRQKKSFSPNRGPLKKTSYSPVYLEYLLFQKKFDNIFSHSGLKAPQTKTEFVSYLEDKTKFQKNWTQKSFDNFLNHSQFNKNNYPFLLSNREWDRQIQKFYHFYSLQTGDPIDEDHSLQELQSIVRRYRSSDRWEEMRGLSVGGDFFKVVSKACHFIPHPLKDKDQFKQAVQKCVEKIYPIYALATTVHEIGHSVFSLRHNFAGSADSRNFYSQDEFTLSHLIPFLSYKDQQSRAGRLDKDFSPISSSVMEYISMSDGEQWAPGSYDVAALQALFSDFAKKPGAQENISFLQCSDENVGSSVYCRMFDQYNTPKKMALHEIQKLFTFLDNRFYSIDRMNEVDIYYGVYRYIHRLMTIYYNWREKVGAYTRKYMKLDLLDVDKKSWAYAIDFISKKASSGTISPEERELLDFYQARNLIYHALVYLAFIPNKYCVLELDDSSNIQNTRLFSDQKIRVLLELSKVMDDQLIRDDPSMENRLLSCWKDDQKKQPHPSVQKYLQTYHSDYTLTDEVGHFLYPPSYQEARTGKYLSFDKAYYEDYPGTVLIRAMAFAALSMSEIYFQPEVPILGHDQTLITMMNETDIREELQRLILARNIHGVFFSNKGFLESTRRTSIQKLTPQVSSNILFNFPLIQNNKDPIFRSSYLQEDKLRQQAEKPHSRDDRHSVEFYQNFLEEFYLIQFFNNQFIFGNLISKGLLSESVSQSAASLYEDVGARYSNVAALLGTKEKEFRHYDIFPHLTSSHYFEIDDFILFPRKRFLKESFGHLLIGELSQNLVRSLWTSSNFPRLWGFFNSKTGKNYQGFTTHITSYLRGVLESIQGDRLGRIYFMYSYLLILGLLEAYEQTAISYSPSSEATDFHNQALLLVDGFINHMSRSFFSIKCHPDIYKELGAYHYQMKHDVILETDEKGEVSERRIKDIDEELALAASTEEKIMKLCPGDFTRKRGKMLELYERQETILNREKSIIHLETMFPGQSASEFLGPIHNQSQEAMFNDESFEFRRIVEFSKGHFGVLHYHNDISEIFRRTFPEYDDKDRMVDVIRAHKQILIDIVPKLLLMYSNDRQFIREMMFMMSQIYPFCFYSNHLISRCHLQIERIFGYYLRRSPFFLDQKIEEAFYNPQNIDPRQGIPFSALVHAQPRNLVDRLLVYTPLHQKVISDFLFNDKGWDKFYIQQEELDFQKDLLFNLLPFNELRFLSASSIFKYYLDDYEFFDKKK